jgi:hypothetical protein
MPTVGRVGIGCGRSLRTAIGWLTIAVRDSDLILSALPNNKAWRQVLQTGARVFITLHVKMLAGSYC